MTYMCLECYQQKFGKEKEYCLSGEEWECDVCGATRRLALELIPVKRKGKYKIKLN